MRKLLYWFINTRFGNLLPRGIRNLIRMESIASDLDELVEAIDIPESRRAFYRFGGVAGIESSNNPIDICSDTRQGLLQIIEAIQGRLYPGDLEQGNRELLRGVWSLIKSDVWDYGIDTNPYALRSGNRSQNWIKRYDEEVSRLREVLRSGGLVVLLEAQLTFWETIRTRFNLYCLEGEIDRFLPRWNRLASQLSVFDPNAENTSRRIEELRDRSKEHEQYPYI